MQLLSPHDRITKRAKEIQSFSSEILLPYQALQLPHLQVVQVLYECGRCISFQLVFNFPRSYVQIMLASAIHHGSSAATERPRSGVDDQSAVPWSSSVR